MSATVILNAVDEIISYSEAIKMIRTDPDQRTEIEAGRGPKGFRFNDVTVTYLDADGKSHSFTPLYMFTAMRAKTDDNNQVILDPVTGQPEIVRTVVLSSMDPFKDTRDEGAYLEHPNDYP